MKKLLCVILSLIMLTSISLAGAPTYESKTVSGVKANVVKVKLEKGVKLRVAKNNDKLIGAVSFQSMVNTYGAKAAINANYFDAYNTLEPMATIIKGKQVIHMVGNTASLMVYDDYKVHLDTLTLSYKGSLDGKTKNEWNNNTQAMDFNTFSVWYVNQSPNDQSGVYIFTKYRNKDIILNGGWIVEVVNNVVGKTYSPAGKITIPENGYVIYYGPQAADKNYVDQRFKPGRTVGLELVDQTGSSTFKAGDKDIKYSDVSDMIAAGPMVVKNGKNVAAENKKAFKEAKINTNSAQRSAIGVTANNELVMVTCVANMEKLAQVMIVLGCKNAMNLDGGASSALYVNGKCVKPAGRNLNTIFMVQ